VIGTDGIGSCKSNYYCHDTTEILLKVAINIITLHKCLTSSTLAAVLAEVSINIKPCSLAKASPSSF
jgi:hypothetical protein